MQETSVSEPLMIYRNVPLVDVEIGGYSLFRDQLGSHPISGPSDIRYQGGVTVHQALVRNVRTCRRDVKEERQASGPCEAERTDARHRGGAARSSDDDSRKRVRAKGLRHQALSWCQPARGRAS
jgi:hypothetical protein